MKKLIVVVMCMFFLNACSIKMAYRFLGFLGKWYVGSYVSLDHEQKEFVDDTLDNFHVWHRKTQLPVYVAYFDEVIPYLEENKITGEWVHQQTDLVQDMLDASMLELKPEITDLMASFSDEQVKEVSESLAKDRKKYAKKYVNVSPEKIAKKRKEHLMDYIGRFFGKLTDKQEVWLDEWEASLLDYEELTLVQQKILADKIDVTLKDRSDRAALAALVDEIIFYRSDNWQPKLQEIMDHNQTVTYDFIAKLVNNQTPKQRHKMLGKLEDYRQDCIELGNKS